MNRHLLAILFVISSAPSWAQIQTGSEIRDRATRGEPSTSAGSINTQIDTPSSSWRKNLKFEAFYGISGDVSLVNRGETSENAVDFYFQSMRDIGKNQSVGLRLNGAQNQTNESNRENETVLSDPQILYANPIFDSTASVSFPVLETSRAAGRHEVRLNGGTDIVDSGRLTVGLGVEARGYFYTRDSAGQSMARGRVILTPSYKLAERVSVYTNAILDYQYNKPGSGYQFLDGAVEGASSVKDRIKSDPKNLDRHVELEAGLSIEAIREKLLIEPFLSQVHQYEEEKPSLFDEDETSYNLEFTLSI